MVLDGMNSRKRVLNLLSNQEVDRIPVFSGMGNGTVHGLKRRGWRFAEVHTDAEKMATLAASTYKLFGFECAVVPFDMGVEAEVLGCNINYYPHREDVVYPTIAEKPAEKPEDLDLKIPDNLAQQGRIPLVVEAIKLLKEDLGQEVAIGSWVLGPFTLGGQILDLNALLKTSYKKPDLINGILEALADYLVAIIGIYKEAGADYITVREMGATSDVVSPRMFNSLILPHLQRIFGAIQSPKILHICGDTNPIVELMAEAGADALAVEQKNDLAATKQKLGDRVLVFGNIDPYGVLVQGSPNEVANTVKEVIDNGADAVWPGCDIWPEVPEANMRALMEAVKEYGRKVISDQ
ncbi:MAG: MtaA/CmuA family methyltransferase [Anaerolineae bacterium]